METVENIYSTWLNFFLGKGIFQKILYTSPLWKLLIDDFSY